MQDDQFPIEWLQALNEPGDPCQRAGFIDRGFDVGGIAGDVEVIQVHQSSRLAAFGAQHVGRGDVVRDAIDPGAQAASFAKGSEAAPQREMNFLQQVSAGNVKQIRIAAVRPSSQE